MSKPYRTPKERADRRSNVKIGIVLIAIVSAFMFLTYPFFFSHDRESWKQDKHDTNPKEVDNTEAYFHESSIFENLLR